MYSEEKVCNEQVEQIKKEINTSDMVELADCLKSLSQIRYKGLKKEQRESIEDFFKDKDKARQISTRVIEIAIEDCDKYSNSENVIQLIPIGSFFLAGMGLFLPSENNIFLSLTVLGLFILFCASLWLLHKARSRWRARNNAEKLRSFLVVELNDRYFLTKPDKDRVL